MTPYVHNSNQDIVAWSREAEVWSMLHRFLD